MASSTLALPLLLAVAASWLSAPGQDPARGGDVKKLIADLLAAHRTGNDPVDLKAFTAQMQLVPQRKDMDRITVITDVRFQLEGANIRIKVDEGDRRFESGKDKRGPWARIDDELQNLNDRNWEKDKAELYKRIRLARQLVRFLDPAGFAKSLGDKAKVATENLPGARRTIECRTLSGIIDAFPLYSSAGQQQRAHIKLYLDADSNRLIAVEAAPVDAQGSETAPGEFYTMLDHRDRGGLVLPSKLVFYRLTRERRPMPEIKVQLQQIDLSPKFDASTFDRNKPW